jgi:UDP-N-acetylglucosamine 2-epimerase (non-hydrolysing)
VLVTIHRRESFGAPLAGMVEAIKYLANDSRLNLHFALPVHPNPNVASVVTAILGQEKNITLLPALDYQSMLELMSRSWLVLTDSGGLQEEAPCFSVPVLVLRNITERPEGVEAGVARLIGTDKDEIVGAVTQLAQNQKSYEAMRSGLNPYGDGRAAIRILGRLAAESSETLCSEEPFNGSKTMLFPGVPFQFPIGSENPIRR